MTRLRVAKPKLFELIHYAPHEGQWLVHRSTAPRRVVACGSRWGKSTACAAEATAALLQPAQKAIGWTIAPTLDLTDRVFGIVVRHFETYFPHHIVEYVQRERRLVVTNLGGGRSELFGKSTDRPATLLGEGLTFAIIDEAAELTRETYEQYIGPRLIDRNGWLLAASTPRNLGWFYRMYRRGQDPRVRDFASWKSPSWSNPHLDREVIEAERASMSSDAFAQEYEAEFVGAGRETCFTCNGPSPSVPPVRVVRSGVAIPRCPDCGELVDYDGKTIVFRTRTGTGWVKLITIEDDEGTSAFVEDPFHMKAGDPALLSAPPQP